MPRPTARTITFTIDGREVKAPENSMLVDAAKRGDVEIPVFCYEPKLGQPVGACRMCLVEIEGMPKLQTACSTAVKDGMVVHTSSPRARQAQEGVVEFLLLNHPLDCPVCDKGGECPLQDISFGWGAGRSRFVEPKRHFVKPLALSEKIAIDRERCILCYRCVRFSQEISEDYQLVLAERGAHSYVATFDGRPYEAPFSGNIVELCPVGALTSRGYRFRARPWDIEDSASVCTLCPSQCNVKLTVRDERVMRVMARDNPDVDDGWLCDRGRFAYPALGHAGDLPEVLAGTARVTEPLIRDGGELRPVSWERALDEATQRLERARGRVGALAGGGATNEEGLALAKLVRDALGSPHMDSRPAGRLPLELHRALAEPALQAKVPDLEFAHAVLVLDCDPMVDSPILDLRLRKGARRRGVTVVRAGREQLLDEGRRTELIEQLRAAGPAEGGEGEPTPPEVVVLWHERLGAGPDGERAVRALLDLADTLKLAGTDGAGLLEIPAHANGRGLREAGVLPDDDGLDAAAMAEAFERGELSCLYLLGVDPPASGDGTIVAHAAFLTGALRAHADVVFPGEAYPEKEGTVTHPDGLVQRVRRAVRHLGEVRDERQVLEELAARVGAAVPA